MQPQASSTAVAHLPPPQSMIDIADVRKHYRSGAVVTEVLKGVSLQLEAGAVGVILGPSGSGKSTLMNIIGGLDRCDAGRVVVEGTDVARLSDDQLTAYRRAQLGFIFQFYNLVPNLTVAENIELVSTISAAPLDTGEVLAAVELHDKRHRFPRELSGGEQQRVAIARAIVKNPRLLLCDEPTGALDYATARGILELLQRVNSTYGTTVLMITHNAAIAAMAHRVYRLRSGEVVEVLENPTTVSAERIAW